MAADVISKNEGYVPGLPKITTGEVVVHKEMAHKNGKAEERSRNTTARAVHRGANIYNR